MSKRSTRDLSIKNEPLQQESKHVSFLLSGTVPASENGSFRTGSWMRRTSCACLFRRDDDGRRLFIPSTGICSASLSGHLCFSDVYSDHLVVWRRPKDRQACLDATIVAPQTDASNKKRGYLVWRLLVTALVVASRSSPFVHRHSVSDLCQVRSDQCISLRCRPMSLSS